MRAESSFEDLPHVRLTWSFFLYFVFRRIDPVCCRMGRSLDRGVQTERHLGMLVLLIPPVKIAFALFHWRKARTPAFCVLGGGALIAVCEVCL
jgi:hypothetical protein